MKMSHRKPPVVEKPPVFGVALDRIHSDAEGKMPTVFRPQVEAFAINRLTVFNRFVFGVEKTDVAVLLQKDESAERDRQNHRRRNQNQFAAARQRNDGNY